MKYLTLVLALGVTLSASAQNNPKGNVREMNIEPTGNQITPSNGTPTPTYTPTNSTHVRNDNPVEESRREDNYRRDEYDYRRGSRIDDTYNGRYNIPPTRNQMRNQRGQGCFTQFELNTRPFSLLNGYWNAGMEIGTSCKTSLLFDFATGTNNLFDIQATSGMVGFRFYSKTDMLGRYITTRARYRSYENGDYSGGNISLMAGYKANWDGVTAAAEVGLGYQGVDGEYLTLPTYAITLGYRL
tara:strand:+ start:128 stop:853 length:726 start_codon:yes stop_codon:yes gene_type:complete